LHRLVESAGIQVRQIVGLIVGGLLITAGAGSVDHGVSGIPALHVVLIATAVLSMSFVVAGIVQWHRKVYV
jgi:hypothetical protein